MKLYASLALLPIALLAACSGAGADNAASPVASAPVAAKPAPTGKAWVDVVAATPEGGYRMGNPDAPLKLIEFGSRACPTCARFDAEGYPALKAGLIASGKLSYEFREYPVHGALDIAPILLGQCVPADAFFPMLDQMMTNQSTLLANVEAAGRAAQAVQGDPAKVATVFAEQLGYLDFVKQRGIPEAQARACLTDKAKLEALARNTDAANKEFGVGGTPTFVLNGKKIENVADWASLEPVLKAAGG